MGVGTGERMYSNDQMPKLEKNQNIYLYSLLFQNILLGFFSFFHFFCLMVDLKHFLWFSDVFMELLFLGWKRDKYNED